MKFRNLTPHDINLADEKGAIIATFPTEGKSLRVATEEPVVKQLDGFNVVKTTYKEVVDLPQEEEGTILIVSVLVLQAMKNSGRKDLVSPNTSPNGAIRNDKGQIIAVKSFTVL